MHYLAFYFCCPELRPLRREQTQGHCSGAREAKEKESMDDPSSELPLGHATPGFDRTTPQPHAERSYRYATGGDVPSRSRIAIYILAHTHACLAAWYRSSCQCHIALRSTPGLLHCLWCTRNVTSALAPMGCGMSECAFGAWHASTLCTRMKVVPRTAWLHAMLSRAFIAVASTPSNSPFAHVIMHGRSPCMNLIQLMKWRWKRWKKMSRG